MARSQLSEADSLGYLLRDTYRALSRELLERIAPHGIGLGQWYFLRSLWNEDGLPQRELSRRVGLEQSTAVTALRALENGGLIRRVRDENDGRRRLVYLTPRGRKLQDRLIPIARDLNAAAVADLSAAETKQLKRLIGRVHQTLIGGR